jgi:hypothetical protein
MLVKIELTKPIESEGQEIHCLEFREPTCDDIIVCGYPFILSVGSATDADSVGEQNLKFDTSAIAKIASRLAGVPKSTIKKLSITDFQKVVDTISGFFA